MSDVIPKVFTSPQAVLDKLLCHVFRGRLQVVVIIVVVFKVFWGIFLLLLLSFCCSGLYFLFGCSGAFYQ